MEEEIKELKILISQLSKRLNQITVILKEKSKENEKVTESSKESEKKGTHITFYKNHKEVVLQRNKEYIEKLKVENPEKLREYRRKAYQKVKDKRIKDKDANKTIVVETSPLI
jgi:hypothetical protein